MARNCTVARVLADINRHAVGSVEDFNLEVFLTKARYAEKLKVLTEAPYDTLQKSYLEAILQAILPAQGDLNGKHLYEWAVKARTKEFGDRVAERQTLMEDQQNVLDESAADGMTALDVTRKNAFEVACSQYKMETSATVNLYDEFTRDVLSRIETMKTEALSDLSSMFSVVTDYKAESEEEVNKKCWEKFVDGKSDASEYLPVITECRLANAIHNFGPQVRAEHQAAYLRDTKRAEQLDELTRKVASPFRIQEATKLKATLAAAAHNETTTQVALLELTHDPSRLSNSPNIRVPSIDPTGSAEPPSTQDRGEKRQREHDSYGDESRDRQRRHGSERNDSPYNDANEATASTSAWARPAPRASTFAAPSLLASSSPAPFMTPQTQRRDFFGKGWAPANSTPRDLAPTVLASAGGIGNGSRNVQDAKAVEAAGRPHSKGR